MIKKIMTTIIIFLISLFIIILNPFQSSSDEDKDKTNDYISEYIDVETEDIVKKTDGKIENMVIKLNKKDIQSLYKSVSDYQYYFEYAKYFALEDSMNLYSNTVIHKKTSSSLLNNKGEIDVDKLVNRVQSNNKEYMSQGKNAVNAFYKELSTSDIYKICAIICEVVNDQYIDIDINKISNTLMNLKIFEKTGSASNAYVTNDLTFVYNPTMTSMYSSMQQISGTNKNMEETFKSVIVHEVMHLLQYSASDNDNNNGVEAGFSRMYNVDNDEDKVAVDSLWYSWLLEASAEINMADYLNVETGTYAKKISYVRSFNLSRFNDLDLETNGLEDVAFCFELDDVYKKLNLKTKNKKNDFHNYMYSIEITQTNPDDFWNNYSKQTGLSPSEEEKEAIRMKIREDAIIYLTYHFYLNLVDSIDEGKITDLNTIFYLMKNWELDAYNHLEYTKISSYDYAKEFIEYQQKMHDLIFNAIAKEDVETIKQMYENYTLLYQIDDIVTDQCDFSHYSSYTQDYLISSKDNYNTKQYASQQKMYEYIRKMKK